MFGTSIRVNPWFWVVSALLGGGADFRNFDLREVLLWVGCVFLSILIHEFGHVSIGRLFGTRGNIVLYSFGGLAIGSSNFSSPWKRIAVSFGGPGFGFLFLSLLLLGFFSLFPARASIWMEHGIFNLRGLYRAVLVPSSDFSVWASMVLFFLVQINLFWGLVNLLPILPLDGGHISQDFLNWLLPGRGNRIALIVSLLVSGGVAIYFLAKAIFSYSKNDSSQNDFFLAFFFGLLAFGSYQMLQQAGGFPSSQGRWPRRRDDSGPWNRERAPWERDPDFWKK